MAATEMYKCQICILIQVDFFDIAGSRNVVNNIKTPFNMLLYN